MKRSNKVDHPWLLYQKKDVIAINKPVGVPSQPDKSGDRSALDYLQESTNRELHMLNRLDRPVSGLLLFVIRNKKAIQYRISVKEYLALIPQIDRLPKKVDHFIRRNGRTYKAEVLDSYQEGFRMAELEVEVVTHLERYTCVRLKTLQGRFHQIRAQLAAIGLPIKGDVKYGARRGNKDRGIDLHGYRLAISKGTHKEIITAPINRDDILWHLVKDHLIRLENET